MYVTGRPCPREPRTPTATAPAASVSPEAARQPPASDGTGAGAPGPGRTATVPARIALACLAGGTIAMFAVGASGTSVAVPAFPSGLPQLPLPWLNRLPDAPATITAWTSILLGAAGVAAGLAAIRRGWRPRLAPLLVVAALAVIALVLVPPVGSTDMLDYAVYGRIAALGHSPYVVTPQQLWRSGDPVGVWRPDTWRNMVSVYGPLATLASQAASFLGGTSIGRTIAWLKVWNALAFLAVALALHRLLRADPAARIRAHLLWTANPLMLFAIMAGGHVDGLAAAFGFLGLIWLRGATSARPTAAGGAGRRRATISRAPTASAFGAGLLLGAAIDVKASLAIFLAAAAWESRESRRTVAAIAAGTLAVLVPSYAVAGHAAVAAVLRRATGSADIYQPWTLLTQPARMFIAFPQAQATNALALAASVLLLLVFARRFPAGHADVPFARMALAFSLAWLVVSPQQRPWFDAMVFPLLAVMPTTRLDWVLIVRSAMAAAAEIPGNLFYTLLLPHWLAMSGDYITRHITPLVLAVCVAVLLWLCRSGNWTGARAPAGDERRIIAWWFMARGRLATIGQPSAAPVLKEEDQGRLPR